MSMDHNSESLAYVSGSILEAYTIGFKIRESRVATFGFGCMVKNLDLRSGTTTTNF
jgi:hypothetical protein